MNKIVITLLFIFSTLVSSEHIMATASKTGMYFAMSKQCTNNLTLINTKGSLENIKLLKDTTVSVALAQKDALKLMLNLDVIENLDKNSFNFKNSNLKFHYFDLDKMKEFIHLLIRKKDISKLKLDRLDGYKISHGHLGSGSYITANNIKDILWGSHNFKLRSVEHNSMIDALYLLDDGSIDIAVSVQRKRDSFIKNPNSVVKKLLDKMTLIQIDTTVGDFYGYDVIYYDWMDEEKVALSVNPVIIYNSEKLTKSEFESMVNVECFGESR